MSPWQVRTRSNGGRRFCRLSTPSPSLAASTWQSEPSTCAFMSRSEPDAASLHPTQQFFQKKIVPILASILGFLDRHSYKRIKKMTAVTVAEVSQNGDTAGDVHRRFMHPAMPMPDGVSYSARCRQLRARGGDCHHFLPLPSGQGSTRAKDCRRRQIQRFFRGSSKNLIWTVWIFEKTRTWRDKPVHQEKATSNSRGRVG